MNGRLNNKIAVVIGAAGPIGSSITKQLLLDGAIVYMVDETEQSQEECTEDLPGDDGRKINRVVNLQSYEQLKELIEKVTAAHKRIDILVNAAWGHGFGLIEEMDELSWGRDIEYNLSLTYRSIRAAAVQMKKQKYGRIVNLASTAKDGTPWFAATGHSGHAAARGGVVGLTRALSYEFGAFGITINCVVVGPLNNHKAKRAFQKVKDNPHIKVHPEDMIALGHLGSPQDVAYATAFLASDEASFITGNSLYVSGGLYG